MNRACGVVLSLATLLGCEQSPAVEFQGSVEEVNGVRVVQNPAPVFGVVTADSTTLAWRVRVDEGSDLWAAPTGLRLGTSRIFVVDPTAAAIHRVTLAGDVERSLGSPGGGPGELSDLDDVVPLPDGDLLVVDQGSGSVERWTHEGELKESLLGGALILGARPWDGNQLLFTTRSPEEGLEPRLMDSAGNFLETPSLPSLEPREYEADSACRRYAYVAETFWTVRCYELTLNRLTETGDIELEIETADEPMELSETDLDDARRRFRETLSRSVPPQMLDRMVERELSGLRMIRRFPSVRVDEESGLVGVLEQTSEPMEESNATLHLFTTAGIYLRAVEFDAHWVDFAMRANSIFALEEHPRLGLVSLLRYDFPSYQDEIERLDASVSDTR